MSEMQTCCYTIINEHTAYTQVVKFNSSYNGFTTEDFDACDARFKGEVLPEYQRGSANFDQLVKHLGKPKEIKLRGSTTRFVWLDVDGTDHNIIKSYIKTATSAKSSRSFVDAESIIKPWVDIGEGFVNLPKGVACVVKKQDLEDPSSWDQVRTVLTRLWVLFCK